MSDSEDSPVLLPGMDERTKGKLTKDLACICEVTQELATQMLIRHSWDIQAAIDEFMDDGNEEEDDLEEILVLSGSKESTSDVTPVPAPVDSKKTPTPELLNMEIDKEGPVAAAASNETASTSNALSANKFSTWAPESFSVLSWNVDGLDSKNLDRRTQAVVELVKKENHDVLFFQELLPQTFDFIARNLSSNYHPIPGTEDPNVDYLTGTFLRRNHVIYKNHYIVPYPGSSMGRNLLVTEAFIGKAKLYLLNTHLESTKDFTKERVAQLKICFQLCSTFPPEYNIIFGGDLNLRDNEVDPILPENMSDLWVVGGSRKTCQYTWDLTRNTNLQMQGKFQPKMRFDRFYFRSSVPSMLTPQFFGITGIEKVPRTQSFPSDHWAIMSFFNLSTEARKPVPKKRKAETETETGHD